MRSNSRARRAACTRPAVSWASTARACSSPARSSTQAAVAAAAVATAPWGAPAKASARTRARRARNAECRRPSPAGQVQPQRPRAAVDLPIIAHSRRSKYIARVSVRLEAAVLKPPWQEMAFREALNILDRQMHKGGLTVTTRVHHPETSEPIEQWHQEPATCRKQGPGGDQHLKGRYVSPARGHRFIGRAADALRERRA